MYIIQADQISIVVKNVVKKITDVYSGTQNDGSNGTRAEKNGARTELTRAWQKNGTKSLFTHICLSALSLITP